MLVCGVLVTACSKLSNLGKPKRIPRADASAMDGQLAPDFTLPDVNGQPFTLSEQKGKVVFLDFWATWCPPCQMSVPELMKLHKEYAGKGVEIVSLSVDDNVKKVIDFVAAKGITHRQLMVADSQVDRTYGVRGIPMFVIIDKEGKIQNLWTGFTPSMVDEWRSELDRLLKA